MQKTGDPSTLAPEICVEVTSEPSDWEEMRSKRELYREAGAEEVWVVDEGTVRFFGEGGDQSVQNRSRASPTNCPDLL